MTPVPMTVEADEKLAAPGTLPTDMKHASGGVQPSGVGLHACRWCGATGFQSRNKLFAHVRGSQECTAAAANEDENATRILAEGSERRFAAVVIGYTSDAAGAEQQLAAALESAGALRLSMQRASSDTIGSEPRQERSCAAVGDVVSVTYSSIGCAGSVIERAGAALAQGATSVNDGVGPPRMLRFVELPSKLAFHAESYCTQRTYAYLLPLRAMLSPTAASLRGASRRPLRELQDLYRDVKRFLKAATTSGTQAEVRHARGCPRLARRHWHNFALPGIVDGELDPRTGSVQSVLDKFQTGRPLMINGEEYMEFRMTGERFLPQQCRRMVATIVCMVRGWLPPDFFSSALRSDVVVSTPVAPENLLYMEDCRFLNWENRNGRLFPHDGNVDNGHEVAALHCGDEGVDDVLGDCDVDGKMQIIELLTGHRFGAKCDEWRGELHALLGAREAEAPERIDTWLDELETVTAPRIVAQLEQVRAADAFARGEWRPLRPIPSSDDCPTVYADCLRLLQLADSSGRWPESSYARAKVIREGGGGGTFSVGRVGEGQHQPKGNEAFPELTEAVFELERAIGPTGRTPSTMVAINRNAQFAPHTDVGTSRGQSKSLIVGLGSYVGGELAVEGDVHDVRYRPLEFNGWRHRHWTLPFAGQRFSLVWFTPA
eukprot:TRINITY_DN36859_c0_g1_i1.p1 TRINITY_DN36859_c0_g1~~TRINITY_DN36859_c0_g1_i1.p1  ORF type:complete len:688 (-),score=109.54 TRINITY_DN36859_c0_g1_i1:126-2108(-)